MSMQINRLVITFVALFSLLNLCLAQTPTHFRIGESALANADIYSILQTKGGRLYVASDNGIYTYEHNRFTRIPAIEEQKGGSFFKLAENIRGEIYCHNLKGQVFQLVDDKLKLYYEFSEIVNQLDYFFDTNGDLLIFTNNVTRVKPDGSVEIVIDARKELNVKHHEFIRPMQMLDGTILGTSTSRSTIRSADLFFVYKQGNAKFTSYNSINWNTKDTKVTGSISAFKLKNKIVYATEFGDFSNAFPTSIISRERYKLSQINDHQLFSIFNKQGANFWEVVNDTLVQHETIFPNTFISSFHYNEDGSMLLGTFGEGIIVIPNINTNEVSVSSFLRGIDVRNGVTYVSSRDGSIFSYKDRLKIETKKKLNVDEVFVLKYPQNFLSEKHLVASNGSLSNFSMIKALAEGEQGFFTATNMGINYSSDNLRNGEINRFNQFPSGNKNSVRIYGTTRYTSITYDKLLHEVYFSDFNKVEYIQGKNNPKELKYKGQSIRCVDLGYGEGSIYVATANSGVLIFNNHEFEYKLDVTSGLASDFIKKIKIVGKLLYVLTDLELQVVDLQKKSITTVSSEHGKLDNIISNFSADEQNLLLLKSNSFISIPTTSFDRQQPNLTFHLDSLTTSTGKINANNQFNLDYTENELIAYLNFKDIVRSRDTEFQIKIDNKKWESYPATQNRISIQNFDYGMHTVLLRLEYQGEYYGEKIFKFKKLAPIYLRWWFYPIILLIIAAVIILFFRRKLRLQAREANRVYELNSSKLTAIQSQMNPHFVFNALNSIQHLVIKGDTDNAYNYITRFANLVRRTLDYSDKETISIIQEIELLDVYLELEKLRFKVDFEYEFEKVKIRDVQTPPMLIQPFIENALVHGLLHKEGEKRLKVYLELKEDYLICKVEDNGIGRDEAKKIRHRQRGDHKSFALNAIDNRFRILNEYSGIKLGYYYEDFPVDNGGIVTRVTLTIPIK